MMPPPILSPDPQPIHDPRFKRTRRSVHSLHAPWLLFPPPSPHPLASHFALALGKPRMAHYAPLPGRDGALPPRGGRGAGYGADWGSYGPPPPSSSSSSQPPSRKRPVPVPDPVPDPPPSRGGEGGGADPGPGHEEEGEAAPGRACGGVAPPRGEGGGGRGWEGREPWPGAGTGQPSWPRGRTGRGGGGGGWRGSRRRARRGRGGESRRRRRRRRRRRGWGWGWGAAPRAGGRPPPPIPTRRRRPSGPSWAGPGTACAAPWGGSFLSLRRGGGPSLTSRSGPPSTGPLFLRGAGGGGDDSSRVGPRFTLLSEVAGGDQLRVPHLVVSVGAVRLPRPLRLDRRATGRVAGILPLRHGGEGGRGGRGRGRGRGRDRPPA